MKLFSLLFCSLNLARLAVFGADPETLTLAQAREIALDHHPMISAAQFRVLAAREETIEARSAYFPTITANATAVGTSQENTRLAAGSLSNPGIYNRNAEGIMISQLITDFGRTADLTATAKFKSKAEEENRDATQAQIILLLDTDYFDALRAESILNVAKQTLLTRELLLNQVGALASNKLKSELDVSFAKVTLDEGKLLSLRASNDVQAAYARLSTLLGSRDDQQLKLIDEPLSTNRPADAAVLVSQALNNRPELLELRYEKDAALKFARAERALHYPVITAMAGAGIIPVRDSQFEDNYAVAEVNLSLPLFAGGLHVARQKEARFRADATEELLRARENEIIRDVRIGSLTLQADYERMTVTRELLENASRSYDLAKARYDAGGTSIIELSQAQLNKTSAEIADTTAKYDYQIELSALNFQIGAPLPRSSDSKRMP